ncbi:membrane protein [Sphingobacterium sp. Ag1]|jgi:TonB-linked SusC/RagA family outer membrane protein|uniref:SusC/RagA family TonB-linked outer membrane protein n=1 Tax=Sphingobacterium sp. Ag1 TaxID=1643451 RepID=UPI000627E586|nr:SusC/RagA family TonB-linked outer membrane protein [Sphingobacterium sp. Ag1]KKO92259.1 membrane protein [Sphingobacterium sp. Ag1]MDF2851947.1 rane protein [Sphingobacterium multivorum]
MNKKFLLFCSGVMLSTSLWAQTKTVTGKVTNASDGGTMPNVTVSIKGKSVSTQTKPDGSFTINAEPGDILIFRAVGSQERQQLVGTNATINVTLSGSEEALEEVVVTAMGIKKEKKALGYAVQDIKSDELMKNKTANVVNSLAGKIAGVNVTQASGSAGAGAQIILRGGTSLERDNQPLFVVDGVIYDNSTVIGGNSAFDGAQATATSNSNRVMDINPEDIDNVSVLKGPAAAALYGSRAAAGAIIITTKKGQEGRTEIGFSSRFSNNWVNRLPEQQGKYKRGYYNSAGVLDDYTTQSWGEKFGSNDVVYNNVKDFFQHSTVFDNTVNLSGGNKNGSFYLSGSRFDQKGIVPNTSFDKTTFRFNGDQKFGKLTVGANVGYSLANTDKTLTSAGLWGSGGTGAMESLYSWSRSDNMKKYLNDDGSKYRMFEGRQPLESDVENPYWTINKNILGDNTERITGSINASMPIFDWWSLTYRVGMDSYLTKNSTIIGEGGAIKKPWQKGMMSESDFKYNYWSSNIMSNFNKKVGDFDLGALVGFFSEQTKTTTNRRMGYHFEVDNFYSFENIAAANKQFAVNNTKKRLFGLYGELRASYKNMLFLNVTGRNDWTSTLPVDNRSYFYPSVGGSFVFTELMKDSRPDWLDFGKLRASWARVGKDANPYVTNTYLWKPVEYLGGIVGAGNNWQKGNPFLKPETTGSFEVGAELRFFKGRLGVDYAYYTNNSYNQILSPRLGQSTGYIFISVNGGDIYNKGMELSLTGKPIVKNDFVWESTLNMSRNKGTVDNLLAGVNILYVTDVQVGNAKAASFNGGNFMGISGSQWTRTPDGKVVLDANTGMPTSDNQTTYNIGNREPKLTGGFNNSLTYKNFNLSFLFDFRIGGDIYNGTDYAMTINGMSKRTEDRDQLILDGAIRNGGTNDAPVYENKTFTFLADQMYTIKGVSTSGRKIIQDYWSDFYARESANFMVKTNWLRLRNISMSYNFSDGVLKNAGVSKVVKGLTATLTGTNLWLLTNYKGLDPEASAAGSGVTGSSSVGIDYNGVPSTAGVMFGLNFRF